MHTYILAWPYLFSQIEDAFAPGYDPALELATHASPVPSMEPDPHSDDELWTQHLCRREQEIINRIVHGKEHSHYWLFLGQRFVSHQRHITHNH